MYEILKQYKGTLNIHKLFHTLSGNHMFKQAFQHMSSAFHTSCVVSSIHVSISSNLQITQVVADSIYQEQDSLCSSQGKQ